MIIFKCFLCNFESNSKNVLKSKVAGETYKCPECKSSHGCLVDAETQREFPSNYKHIIRRNKDVPIYYGKLMDKYEGGVVNVALQVFEAIHIKEQKFVYVTIVVPGMYMEVVAPWQRMMSKSIAIIGIVGENVLTTVKSRNPKSQILDYSTKFPDDASAIKTPTIIDKSMSKEQQFEAENMRLIDSIYEIDLYKILEFDVDYLLESPLYFKKSYPLPKPLISRLKKKYETNQIITYNDLKDLNKLWHTYERFYMGLPSLYNIELWLEKAWKSKAVCCGVVPFAPLAQWYNDWIIGRAEAKLLKRQTGIPFPLVEFSYRYIPTQKTSTIKKKPSLMTATDKKLGQQMFNFGKRKEE